MSGHAITVKKMFKDGSWFYIHLELDGPKTYRDLFTFLATVDTSHLSFSTRNRFKIGEFAQGAQFLLDIGSPSLGLTIVDGDRYQIREGNSFVITRKAHSNTVDDTILNDGNEH